MSETITPQTPFEESALAQLEQRGWTVTGGERRGHDLDIFVRFEGVEGKLACRWGALEGFNPFWEPDHCSFRLELGKPAGPPSRWARWDVYSFPKGHKYVVTIGHEAIGDGWTQVAGTITSDKRTYRVYNTTIENILVRAEDLAPSRDEATRRHEIYLMQRSNFGPQREKLGAVGFFILFLFFFVIPTAWNTVFLLDEVVDDFEKLVGLAVGSVGHLIGLIIVLVYLVRYLRREKKPLEGMSAVVEALRGAGLFESFDLTPAKHRHGLPVAVGQGESCVEGSAPMSVSRVTSTSPGHGLTLEADLCQVTWPEGVDLEVRFLPDRWITVDLKGADDILGKLPEAPRVDRGKDRIRWHFTGEEFDDGTFQRCFQSLATTLGSAS